MTFGSGLISEPVYSWSEMSEIVAVEISAGRILNVILLLPVLGPLIFNVKADGLMRQRGLDGKFVVLQCNDWKFGMTNRQLSTALQGDANGIRKIKLAQVMGEGADMHLGPTRTIKFPEGVLGVLRSYESLPESIFREALRRSGR